ncbi:signal peptide peptidase SppA [Sutterella sp.]|uniref:signal peptide peptidase SppA n=1 Tax=Sutterella sp. TaxID=1981025 RepID=UPI0026E0F5D1|nr:signal peptide peptidase SppA [Sutterella sp.]MDO5532121.1 signal peptide peptidase SppA [Sutterella sp.]
MRFLRWVGLALDFIRRLTLNVIFYGVIIAVAAVWFFTRPETPVVEPRTVLVLDLAGSVVESDPMEGLALEARMLMRRGTGVTRLTDVTDALERASKDPDIAGVEIVVDDLSKIGLASARTIGRSIDRFREATGRPIYVWADSFTQGQYAAAAHADEISLHPMGSVMLRGLSGAGFYWGGLLDRLGIGVSVYKAGAYKSAPEVFTNRSPSAENIEAQRTWLSASWKGLSGDIEKARGLMPGSVDRYLDQLPERLAQGTDPAEYLKESGLVTDLLTVEAYEQKLAKRFAEGGKVENLKRIHFIDYLNARHEPQRPGDGVAVVLAEGAIAPMEEAGIDPSELCDRLEAAADEPGTKAIVLRISSPGGDALSAEAIRETLASIRARGIHVVASMGDTAASGGYWVSLAAERIVADPLTLTGSIGVFSIVPDAEKALDEWDIGRGGYRTNELADFGAPLHRPNAAESAILRAGVERIYDRFKALAAQSRGRTVEEIERVAQGRVWTGEQAQKLGLVDMLGDLSDAVRVARQLAGLPENAPVTLWDQEAGGLSAVLARFSVKAAAQFTDAGLPLSLVREMIGVSAEEALGTARALITSRRPLAWAEVPDGI